MKFPNITFDINNLQNDTERYISKAKQLKQPEMLKLALSCIDLTTLNSTDTVSHVAEFTMKVNAFPSHFSELPNVAAICVYPNMATVVRENLAAEDVKVAAVAGGFPSSMTFEEIKIREAQLSVIQGADEIDIVLPLWAFLENNFDYCAHEISAIKTAIGDAHLKVILETGALSNAQNIWDASMLALQSGADFIKTSTGKMPVSATPQAAIVMCHALKYWHETTGEKRGFKPAGGISSVDDAILYIAIVHDILGKDWLSNKLFRIGASRLANNLISEIEGDTIGWF